MLSTIDVAAVHAAAAPDKPPLPPRPMPASPTSLFTRGPSLETRGSLEASVHGGMEDRQTWVEGDAADSPPPLLCAAACGDAAGCSPFPSSRELPAALQALMQQAAAAAAAAPASNVTPLAGVPPLPSRASGSLLDGLATPCQSLRDAAAPRSLPSSADSLTPAAAAELNAELHAELHARLAQHQAAAAARADADAGAAAAAAWLAQQGRLGVAPRGDGEAQLELANLAAAAACSLPLSSAPLGAHGGSTGLSSFQANPWLAAGGLQLPLGPPHAPPALHSALAAQLPPHLSALLVGGGAGLAPRWSCPPLPQHQPGPAGQRQPGGMRRQAATPPPGPPEVLVGLHGRYQPYCQQIISPRMNEAAARALASVRAAQAADPPLLAAALGKRYFCSLKEVSKVVRNARCLIVAPDIQPSATAHINPVRALQRILFDAQAAGVPVVFALSRRGIGQVFGRDKSMSIVALMHLDGLEAEFGVMVEEAVKGRHLFAHCRPATPPPASCAVPDLLPLAGMGLGAAGVPPLPGYCAAATSLLHRLSL